MKKEFTALLNKRIEKLEEKDFDLEAWKSSTIAVLERIFGSGDARIKPIQELKIDYSSWALRDATSTYNPTETCRKKGRELLSALIDEIDILGVPVPKMDQSKSEALKGILSESVINEINGTPKPDLAKALNKEKKENLVAAILKLLEN